MKNSSPARARLLTPLLSLALLAAVGCRRDEDKDLLPPLGSSSLSQSSLEGDSEVKFTSGWYDVETGANNQAWRWMSKRGEIRLRNQGADMKLRLRGWAPVELLATAPTLRLSLNGRELDSFVAAPGHFTREYQVPRDLQGQDEFSTLVVESSATAKPPNDTRELGYSLVSLVWESAKR
jgi:hypothetical protein